MWRKARRRSTRGMAPVRLCRRAWFSGVGSSQRQWHRGCEEARCEEEEERKEPPRSLIYSRDGVTGALVRSYRDVSRIECDEETLWHDVWPCISHTRGSREWQRLSGSFAPAREEFMETRISGLQAL